MQKKLIALAVAGLVSGAAFAQSNVTIYGVVDMGYQHSGSSDTGTLKPRSGVDSGLQSGSRIGFKGEEALGGGNKVGFVLENAIGVDIGTGPLMTRQSYLYAAGSWGTIAAGNKHTPQHMLVSAVDPFGTGTVGDVTRGRGVYAMGTTYVPGVFNGNTTRLNNLVAYVSPNFSGFTVIAGGTASGLADEPAVLSVNNSTAAKIWAIYPTYKNGPLFVGLNYHEVKDENFLTMNIKDKVWDLGGTYDFGVAKLAVLYGENGLTVNGMPGALKQKQYMLGVTVPVSGADKVLVSYSHSKHSDNLLGGVLDGARASKWALGYTHDLSKRTNLYAAYAKINTNTTADGKYSTYNVNTNYTNGFNLGLRHSF